MTNFREWVNRTPLNFFAGLFGAFLFVIGGLYLFMYTVLFVSAPLSIVIVAVWLAAIITGLVWLS